MSNSFSRFPKCHTILTYRNRLPHRPLAYNPGHNLHNLLPQDRTRFLHRRRRQPSRANRRRNCYLVYPQSQMASHHSLSPILRFPRRRSKSSTLGVLVTVVIGWLDGITFPGVTLLWEAQDIGLATGVLGSIRALGGAVAQALYVSIRTNKVTPTSPNMQFLPRPQLNYPRLPYLPSSRASRPKISLLCRASRLGSSQPPEPRRARHIWKASGLCFTQRFFWGAAYFVRVPESEFRALFEYECCEEAAAHG